MTSLRRGGAVNKQRSLDLFNGVLPALDKRNFDYWSKLKPEQKKEFAPRVVIRYLSHVSDKQITDYYLIAVNEIANVNQDQMLTKRSARGEDREPHTELVWKMMAACGIGEKQQHEWIKGSNQIRKSDLIYQAFLKFFPDMNEDEYQLRLSRSTPDTIRTLCRDVGMEEKDVKDAVKYFKEKVS